MKKSLSIIIAAIFMAIPVLSFSQQETQTNGNSEPEKKISYSFINEYGFYAGKGIGFTGIFVNGIRFNKTQDLLGIGIGYEADTNMGQSIPVYVNYRHYFPSKKILKPLVNVGIGTRICLDQYYYMDYWYYPYRYKRTVAGFYGTMAAGFKVRVFSFTSGVFVKSVDDNFYGGVEVKVGITF